MIFRIAHAAFRARITDSILHDEQGRETAELFDWANQTIWLSSKMPPQRRLHALFHGIKHGWQMSFGMAADAESDADQSASYAIATWMELERQGGVAALMRLRPDGVVDRTAALQQVADDRNAQCRFCGGYLDAPLRQGEPRFDSSSPRLLVDVEGDCSFCSHIVTWKETCTTRGVRTGTVIGAQAVKAAGHAVPSV